MQEQITIRPGSFIVFEGLDATGKSTQALRLKAGAEGVNGHQLFADPVPHFTRQPGGEDELGAAIYELTERRLPMSAWARQFLHLASHSNHYLSTILPMLQERAVIMDRCWWSTMAYGYFDGCLWDDLTAAEFLQLITIPTKHRMPSIMYVFMQPWEEDRHNTDNLRHGYEWLIRSHQNGSLGPMYGYPVVEVPPMGVEDTTKFIIESLVAHGFTA